MGRGLFLDSATVFLLAKERRRLCSLAHILLLVEQFEPFAVLVNLLPADLLVSFELTVFSGLYETIL